MAVELIEANNDAVVIEGEVIQEHENPYVGEDAFNTLYSQAMSIQERCSDSYSIVPYLTVEHMDSKPYIVNENGDRLLLTQYSFSQLCTKVGVPARYMMRCLNDPNVEMHDLVSTNLNMWLRNEPLEAKFFVRQYDDSVRGILSERYSAMDTPNIIEELYNALPDDIISSAKLKGHFISPERFHARILLGQIDVPNEVLFYGIQIDSSDVGRSVLNVQFLVYKQICTNGLVLPKAEGSLFRQKHIGLTANEFLTDFQTNIAILPRQVEFVTNHIINAKGHQLTHEEYDRLLMKAQVSLKFSDKVAETISSKLVNFYDFSRWGVVNAITDVAKDFTLERRLDFEAAAGKLLLVAA